MKKILVIMFRSHINQFINSSLSIAFLTITSFSTAYCYGWGQAIFHGYPWWHVEIGNASMARSLVYVLATSTILFICYLLGYCLVNKVFKMHYFHHLGWLRVIVLVSVFAVPIILTLYLLVGIIPVYFSIIYFLITVISVFSFQKRWNHTKLDLDFRKMLTRENFWFFNLFIFIYFSLLAFYIGYLRADLRITYDYMELDHNKYYILSTNSDNGYIMGEKSKDNDSFIFFNRDTHKYYHIYVTQLDFSYL